jgi:hypothetical protein
MRKLLLCVLLILTAWFPISIQGQTFSNAYLKLRGSEEGGIFQQFDQKELRRMIDTVQRQGNTEAERQKFLRERALFEQTERIGIVMDFDEDIRPSSSRVAGLLRGYEQLFTMQANGMKMTACGNMVRGKVKELILLMDINDTEEPAAEAPVFFIDLLFKKPIALSDYMDDPAGLGTLFSVNAGEEENNRALFRFDYSSDEPDMIPIPGYNDSEPFKLEVVQVDGKYGIKRTPDFGREYLIEPKYSDKPVIYGTNPGNTYFVIQSWAERDDRMLYDKFGFTVAHGDEILPIYVIGNEAEVAAFIIRDDTGYSLYECPETYALRQEGSLEEDNFALRPHFERRFRKCRSIIPTTDGRLECVFEDGKTEYIAIRKSNRNTFAA